MCIGLWRLLAGSIISILSVKAPPAGDAQCGNSAVKTASETFGGNAGGNKEAILAELMDACMGLDEATLQDVLDFAKGVVGRETTT